MSKLAKIGLIAAICFIAVIGLSFYSKFSDKQSTMKRYESPQYLETEDNNRKYFEKCDTKLILAELDPPAKELEKKPGFRTARWAVIEVLECPETYKIKPANIIVLRYQLKPGKGTQVEARQKVAWLAHPQGDKETLIANLPSKLLTKSSIENWWNLPDGEFRPQPYFFYPEGYEEFSDYLYYEKSDDE